MVSPIRIAFLQVRNLSSEYFSVPVKYFISVVAHKIRRGIRALGTDGVHDHRWIQPRIWAMSLA